MWKQLNKYPKYEISTNGDIRNIKTKKIIKPRKTPKGYLEIDLSYDKHLKIHQLVYFAFTNQEIKQGYMIDHKDGDKTNNKLSNLQYISNRENQLKGTRPNYLTIVRNNDTKEIIMFTSSNELRNDLKITSHITYTQILKSTLFTKKYELIHSQLL